ncbi:MAG: flagellar hook protein FlgE [Thiohalomonadaceae bacterium]
MAFQTALSGLNAASGNLNVTGHNIANSSTTGFKKSRADFADVYAVSFGGVSKTATGSGVRLASVTQQFTQGNIDFTDNNLDLAISGDGFFVLNDNGSLLYTRAGNFSVDRDGYVVNVHGQRVQQYVVDTNTGIVSNFTPSDLQLNLGANPASATTRIDINVNLDAGVTPIDSVSYPALVVNPPDPNTYNFSTTTTIYDSLGVTHEATLYFRRDDTMPDNTWESTLVITDTDGTINQFDTETVQFDTSGTLLTTGDINFLSVPWTPSTGAATVTDFDINFDGSTQFGANSAVNSLSQDGYTTGRLSGISVDSSGVLFARYTNGQSSLVGAIALARFNNPNGLQQVGDTNWAATYESGDVLPGQAGTGTFGEIQSGALEASNVDISKQLVNMIIAQRDFQANAKMITTEDQVTQTIINIR